MAMQGQYEVGQLYNGGYVNGQRVFTQPNGVGTPVVPQPPALFPEQFQGYQQFPVSFAPQYFFSCGHPLNMPEIFSYYDPYEGTVMALICCPLCSYIQEIMPYTQYQDYAQTPIVIA